VTAASVAPPTSARRAPTAAELDFVRGRRVGRLATADGAGTPAVVPICYGVIELGGEPVVVSALDEKPKGVEITRLARVRHIRVRPDVALVVDDYVEDWGRLAFVYLRGQARLLGVGEEGHDRAIGALRVKYPQYARMAIEERPVIAIAGLTATSWRGDGAAGGVAETVERAGGDALAEVVRGRRSVRSFLDRPVPREVVERGIAAAGWAPSPHGRQPWRFAVVEAPARRAALAAAMAETWQEQLEMDGQEAEIVRTRLEKSRRRLYEAPLLIVPCLYLADLDVYPDADRQAAETTMAIQSLGAAIENLLLTLYAAGLDTGWMCAPLFCPEIVRDALGLDVALIPQALLPVGYAAKDPVRRGRLPVEELIVAWE